MRVAYANLGGRLLWNVELHSACVAGIKYLDLLAGCSSSRREGDRALRRAHMEVALPPGGSYECSASTCPSTGREYIGQIVILRVIPALKLASLSAAFVGKAQARRETPKGGVRHYNMQPCAGLGGDLPHSLSSPRSNR